MLSLSDINYLTSPPRVREIFKNLNLCVKEKQNTLIFGENGSGKTMLFNIIMNIVQPSSGRIIYPEKGAFGIFEDFENQLFFSSVQEEIDYSLADAAGAGSILEEMDIYSLKSRSTHELSYSQKYHVVFFQALAAGDEYLIMDNPPEDELVDGILERISANKDRTLILFTAFPENRYYAADWDKYKIKNMGLEPFIGN